MEERRLPCGIVKDLLPSYTDELLSEDVKNAVEEHLKGCENCKKALAEYKQTQLYNMESNNAKEEKFLKDAKSAKYYVIGILIGAAIPFLILVITIVIRMIIVKAQGY